MEIYASAIQTLLDHPQTLAWPELDGACERARTHRPIAWDFPIVAAEAVGASPEAATPAVSALTCAHMALGLVDDLLDEDPRGLHHQLGSGRAANLATALFGLSLIVLLQSNISTNKRAAFQLECLLLPTAYGQDFDVQNPQTEQAYWAVAKAKSSPYFGTGLYLA